MRTISLNAHYIIVLKGIRSNHQIGFLGQQIFPYKSKQLMNIFKKATERPFGYLLFDLHPQSRDELRLRTRITRKEIPQDLASKHSVAPIIFDLDKS